MDTRQKRALVACHEPRVEKKKERRNEDTDEELGEYT